MSYYNFTLAAEKGITPTQIIHLQLISQNRTSDLSGILENELTTTDLNVFSSLDVIEHRKAKNKSEKWCNTIRLNPNGKKLLEDLTTPDVTEDDIRMAEYLFDIYLSHEDTERSVGNKKLVRIYCAQMRNYLGLTLHEFYWLCYYFLQEHTFTKKLEYIFFNSNKNRYGRFLNNVEDSALFQFYDERKAEVQEVWRQKIITA